MCRRVAPCLATWFALTGCHVTSRNEIARPTRIERIRHEEGAIARRPELVWTDAGQLRFVEPLECPTEELVTQLRATEIVTAPNLATFVVGIVAVAAGGVLAIRGLNDDGRASNPFTYAGAGLLAGGLPLVIGPWVGNHVELRELPPSEPRRRPGPSVPCGHRALAARSATLTVRGIEVHGRVDGDGVFAISPFQLVDAFEAATAPAWDVTARVDAKGGARTIEVVFEGNAFGAHAPAFLARADFSTNIEPMRLVPGLVPQTLRVSLTTTADGPAVRLVLPVKNDGPGAAWALRGHVIAPRTPAVDGRILYLGAVAKGATVTRELLIPVTAAAAQALRNAELELAIELRDAHGTAPTTPVRFRGPVLVDAPRS